MATISTRITTAGVPKKDVVNLRARVVDSVSMNARVVDSVFLKAVWDNGVVL